MCTQLLGFPAEGWDRVHYEKCVCANKPVINPFHGHLCTVAGNGNRTHNAEVNTIAQEAAKASNGYRVQIEPRGLDAGYFDKPGNGPDFKVVGFGKRSKIASMFGVTTVHPGADTYLRDFISTAVARAGGKKPDPAPARPAAMKSAGSTWSQVARSGKHGG